MEFEHNIHWAKDTLIPAVQTGNRANIDTGGIIGVLPSRNNLVIAQIATGDPSLELIFRQYKTPVVGNAENTINCPAAISL